MRIFKNIFGIKTEKDHFDDSALIETRDLIAKCEKIISNPRSHPMAVYWAKVNLRSATSRLRHLTDSREREINAQRERERYARKPAQPSGDPRNLMTKTSSKSPAAAPQTLGVHPPLFRPNVN